MFDDFQAVGAIIHIMSEASENTLPVPSGIAIEFKGVGSRQLSHDWAGEWLGSALAQQIQSTAWQWQSLNIRLVLVWRTTAAVRL